MQTPTEPTHSDPRRVGWARQGAAIAAHPATWLALTLAVAALDVAAGPHVTLGLLYLVPLALAAWYRHTWIALAIALALPVARLSYFVFDLWQPPGSFVDVAVNAAIRAIFLTVVVLLIGRTRSTADLERELATLRGLLPICMYCKRIQDAEGQWQPVEQYVGARSGAEFTHRVCPICTDTHRSVFLGSPR